MSFETKNCIRFCVVMAALLVFIPVSFMLTKHKTKMDIEAEVALASLEAEAVMDDLVVDSNVYMAGRSIDGATLINLNEITENAGVGNILDEAVSVDEYIEIANNNTVYGYKHLGIANVDNHLNVREAPEEGAKLVGKMSNNAACEVLDTVDDWIHIKSGEVEGYVFSEYLVTGPQAVVRANGIITKEAESTSGGLRVREKPNTDSDILTTMAEGERLEVVDENLNGWIKVLVDDQEGFISAEYAEIKEELPTAMTMTELMYGEGVSDLRVDLCQFAKKFIGNRYVWGGTSLTKGADCSGFVLAVFKNYGISLPHSSRAQAGMGKKISLGEAKPGDLVFYSGGGRINHVAIYIGGGQVVHASNPRTGIRISSATYRTVSAVRRIIQD